MSLAKQMLSWMPCQELNSNHQQGLLPEVPGLPLEVLVNRYSFGARRQKTSMKMVYEQPLMIPGDVIQTGPQEQVGRHLRELRGQMEGL